MKSFILLAIVACSLVAPAASAAFSGGEDEPDCGGIIPLTRCLLGDGDGAANRWWQKVTPLEEGPHCLPFDGYDHCS